MKDVGWGWDARGKIEWCIRLGAEVECAGGRSGTVCSGENPH